MRMRAGLWTAPSGTRTVERNPMGNSRYIGRVGALAITLGVGWAVASAPGVAYAQPTSSSSASDASSTSTSPSPARTKRAKRAETSASNSSDQSTSDSESAAAGDNAPDATKTPRHRRLTASERRAARNDASAETAADKSTTVVNMVAVTESTAATPSAEPGPEAPPTRTPVILAALGAARDELERNSLAPHYNCATPASLCAGAGRYAQRAGDRGGRNEPQPGAGQPDERQLLQRDAGRHHRRVDHRRAHHDLQPVVDVDPDRRVGREDRRDQQRLHPVDVQQVADGVQPARGAATRPSRPHPSPTGT